MEKPQTHPIRPLSEAEAAALQHDSYLMQIREQSCAHCGSGERWSELFEVWAHPTKTRTTTAHVLRPTLTLRTGYSITYLQVPVVQVPLCSDCIEKYEPGEARVIPASSRDSWRETLKRKYAPQEDKASKPAPHVPTLESL